MSTDRRWDAPNTLHHIMARGLHGQTLFRDDRDLASIIDCVTRACSYFDVRCNAFSPVGNHYHLSALSGRVHISRFTHYVNSTFATAFNLRHGLRGYVFQGRFKNIIVESDAYDLELIRYIHLNLIRAGMLGGLKELIAYPWTSLPTILGRGNFPFVDVSGILRRFDEDPEVARKRLLRFLADGLGASSPFDEAGEKAWGDSDDAPPQIVGSEQFVAGLRAKFESASGIETDPVSWFDELVVAVANERGVDALDLLMGRRLRDVCEARAVVAARAFFVGRLSVKEIASRLGITTTATSRAITRGRSLGATDLRVLPMLGS